MPHTRFYYLDHLRAFAMLFGILVHVLNLADFGSIEIISFISDNFRMGVFYVLSGFFAGMLLDRRGFTDFLRSRALAIGLPLIVVLLVLNPVTLWLVYNTHNDPVAITEIPRIVILSITGPKDASGEIVWHLHLWFLICLLIYIIMAGVMGSVISSISSIAIVRNSFSKIPSFLIVITLAFSVAFAVMAMRLLSSILLGQNEYFWVIRATLTYAPWYVLGLLCWQERLLWESMHKIDAVLLCTVGVLWGATVGNNIPTSLYVFRREVTVMASLCVLLYLFRWVSNKPMPAIAKITDSAYSIYLFHYITMYLLGAMLIPLFPTGSIWLYLIIVGGTFATTYFIHQKIIVRMPVMGLIFNGKTLKV